MTGDAFDSAVVQVFCTLLARPELDVVPAKILAEQSVLYANTLDAALTHDYVLKCRGKEIPLT